MRRWRKIFNTQVDRRARLEQMVEELAKQINKLESQVRSKSMNPGKHYIFFSFLFSFVTFYLLIVQLFHAYRLENVYSMNLPKICF